MSTAERLDVATRRTEASMAAHVIAKLLIDGLLRGDAVSVSAACRSVGVAVVEVQQAWRTIDAGRYVAPNHVGECAGQSQANDRHTAASRQTKRYKQAHDGVPEGHKRCPKCEDVLPLEAFQIKNKRTGSRVSKCRECSKQYQAERYVKVGYKAVAVELIASDSCVGHTCPKCHKTFEIGQVVIGVDVVHLDCKIDDETKGHDDDTAVDGERGTDGRLARAD